CDLYWLSRRGRVDAVKGTSAITARRSSPKAKRTTAGRPQKRRSRGTSLPICSTLGNGCGKRRQNSEGSGSTPRTRDHVFAEGVLFLRSAEAQFPGADDRDVFRRRLSRYRRR